MNFNKVEISSVNTSELLILKEKETSELLKKMKEGDKKSRELLITGNLRLVLSIVQRFRNRDENPDDLFQLGCIGLIKACDNFNTELEVRFSTYAVPMIIGEIKRYLRDNSAVRISRSMRDTAYHAMQVKEELNKKYNREPTLEEIAKEMDLPESSVLQAFEAITDPISLYEPVYTENGDTLYLADQLGDNNDENNWIDELNLKEAIRSLEKREKLILNKRFMEGKTQTEVASEIGISQAQVSRIEKEALKKIKS